MGLIKLESDQSGFSSVFQGWMTDLPQGELKTTSIRMECREELLVELIMMRNGGRVRLVMEGRLILETRLDALLEGIQIALPIQRTGDLFFEVIPGGRFTMFIEWAHVFTVVAGKEPIARVA